MSMRDTAMVFLMAIPLAGAASSCNGTALNGNETGSPDASAGGTMDYGFPGCTGLQCQVANKCGTKDGTAISGVVNIPAGNLPLPNASVYVPNSVLEPIKSGASCNRCDAPLSGNPITRTTTDAEGRFRLEGVPSGADVPLVIQLGKWRRQVTLPKVTACMDNPVEPELSRLPRNQVEGDLPKIALTTGGADALECLLRKLGIADNEFTPESSTGRVNLYNGEQGTARYDATLNGGAAFTPAPTFWESLDNLKKYDVVMHSCEGLPFIDNKSVAARQALLDYLNLGGRAFASHYHYLWIEQGPAPMPTVAKWNHVGDIGSVTADIDLGFAGGVALADWLVTVGASTQRGKLSLTQSRSDVESVNPMLAQRWIHMPAQKNVQYMSFNAPLGAEEKDQCGRMVFTDIHVANGDTSSAMQSFPSGGCRSASFSPQEKALIYMLFDLSNCLAPIPIG